MRPVTAAELEAHIDDGLPTRFEDVLDHVNDETDAYSLAIRGSEKTWQSIQIQRGATLALFRVVPMNEVGDLIGGAIIMSLVRGIQVGMAIQAARQEALDAITDPTGKPGDGPTPGS